MEWTNRDLTAEGHITTAERRFYKGVTCTSRHGLYNSKTDYVCNPCQSSPSLPILVPLCLLLSLCCFSILIKYYMQVSLILR